MEMINTIQNKQGLNTLQKIKRVLAMRKIEYPKDAINGIPFKRFKKVDYYKLINSGIAMAYENNRRRN